MKKSIPIVWERESEAFILGNGREREFPLTPETDLRNVCTLTAVYCMFTHVEAYCLLKIFLSETNISLASAKYVVGCCTIMLDTCGQQKCQREELCQYYFLPPPARLPLEIGAAG